MTNVKDRQAADGIAKIEEAAKAQINSGHTTDSRTSNVSGENERLGGARLPDDLADFTGRTQRNLEAASDCGMIWAQALQEATSKWLELARKMAERNLETFTKVSGAKSLRDAATIQNELIRSTMEDFAKETRAIAATSAAASEAVRKALSGQR
jgi:hypothetical protein